MPPPPTARDKLLDAALVLFRERGFAATSVDDLCGRAGVTKGAFFHHFEGKAALGEAAARHWGTVTSAVFAQAPYHTQATPLARVLAYIDFRRALIQGPTATFTCVAGTLVQEIFDQYPAVRAACGDVIFGHAATLEADIAAAMEAHGGPFPSGAASLAQHTQAVLQGAFILAKAADDPAPALGAVDHLRHYFELLFAPGRRT